MEGLQSAWGRQAIPANLWPLPRVWNEQHLPIDCIGSDERLCLSCGQPGLEPIRKFAFHMGVAAGIDR